MSDLRFAFRQLLKNPGFTAVAVLTLALGIGANTAIFSVVNAVLLRPLPFPESDRLVFLTETNRNFGLMSISYPNFTDWRAQQTVFEHIGVYNTGSYSLTGQGDPLRLIGARISADALTALRLKPAHGRLFTNDEDKPGGEPVVLLSLSLWQNRFGGDSATVRKTINLDGRSYSVIGVLPPDFQFIDNADFWLPVGQLAGSENWQGRGNHPGLSAVARLKPGVSIEQARAEMDTIAVRLEEQYPDSNRHNRVHVEPLIQNRVGDASDALWTLLGAVGFVLLIACANVANLLLARAAARQKEMAIRAALGAGRWRVLRQLLIESILLSLAGAAVGLLLAEGWLRLLLVLASDSIPRSNEIGIDLSVLAFTAGVALLTGIAFGLAPAWFASRTDVHDVLKDAARAVVGGRARLRNALVIAEVAVTLLLLVGAGLLLRSFYRLQTLDPGFSHQGVLTFRLDLPEQKYPSPDQQIRFYQNLTETLRGLPGVQHVGVAFQFPLDQQGWQTSFLIEGQPEPRSGERPSMEVNPASPDYFRALGIRLLHGRHFDDRDNRQHLLGRDVSQLNDGQRWAAGLNTIIVDSEFARRHWPAENPIGKRVILPWGPPAERPLLTVVGVVERVKLSQLNEQGGFVQAYLPLWQAAGGSRSVLLKTTVPPETLFDAVRQRVQALDPQQPIYDLRTLSEVRSRSLSPQRLNLMLLGIFAALAVILAVIGLYGVLAYTVAQRTREIGVRMALGAQRRDVLRLVIRHGMKLVLVGVVVGLLGAFGVTRWLTSLLYEIQPYDPLTLVIVPLTLGAAAFLACWLPARRAAKVDPMEALRYE